MSPLLPPEGALAETVNAGVLANEEGGNILEIVVPIAPATNAVVAIFVLVSVGDGVGALGTPVNAGLARGANGATALDKLVAVVAAKEFILFVRLLFTKLILELIIAI